MSRAQGPPAQPRQPQCPERGVSPCVPRCPRPLSHVTPPGMAARRRALTSARPPRARGGPRPAPSRPAAAGLAQGLGREAAVGLRGTGRHARPGGGQGRAAVGAGRVGAVFACAASRLARTHRDWPHRSDGWAWTATWRREEDGL